MYEFGDLRRRWRKIEMASVNQQKGTSEECSHERPANRAMLLRRTLFPLSCPALIVRELFTALINQLSPSGVPTVTEQRKTSLPVTTVISAAFHLNRSWCQQDPGKRWKQKWPEPLSSVWRRRPHLHPLAPRIVTFPLGSLYVYCITALKLCTRLDNGSHTP